MSKPTPEQSLGRPPRPSRLKRRILRVPSDISGKGSDATEQWLLEHPLERLESIMVWYNPSRLLRRFRKEYRSTRSERRQAEESILQRHPLMVYHEDGRHIFKGTDLDE